MTTAASPEQIADFERGVLDALRYLAEGLAAVKSMAMGGEYEDLPIWQVEQIIDRLTAQIDGSGSARG